MKYRKRSNPSEEVQAFRLTSQKILNDKGKVIYEASLDTLIVHAGNWRVKDRWLTPEDFDALYEPVPDKPVQVKAPKEVPVAPEPAPVVEEPPALAIGPSALDVDQGPMSHNQETP